MPLTFPLTLPEAFLSDVWMEAVAGHTATADGAGRVYGVADGQPLWMLRGSLGRLRPSKSEEVRAFFAALRGPSRTFLAGDPRRPFPLAYANGFPGVTRPTFAGGVAGTPGTPPTGMGVFAPHNSAIGFGVTQDGRAWMSVRFWGTAGGGGAYAFVGWTQGTAAATAGSLVRTGLDVRLQAGTSAGTMAPNAYTYASGGAAIAGTFGGSPPTRAWARQTLKKTAEATTASVGVVVDGFTPAGAYDFTLRIASPEVGIGFQGDVPSWSLNGDRDVLTLGGVPAGMEIARGDPVGFKWTTSGTDRRALVRAVETVADNGAGTVAFTVEPPVPALVPGGAQAHLDRPMCVMRLLEGPTGASGPLGAITGGLVAVQDLRA